MRIITFASLLAFLTVLPYLPGQPAAMAMPDGNQSFSNGGKEISVEWFMPASERKAKKATIIILHGSGGLDKSAGFFRDIAADMARHGRNALVVHYFDQNNISSATSSDMARYFKSWLKTVAAAINYASKQDTVDLQNISLLGHSLGAQLALHTASTDRRVCSVIDMGGSFVLSTAKITTMPPVLVLHGRKDTVVPLSREKSLIAVLERTNSKFEEHIFPEADHVFNHVDFTKLTSLCNDFLERNKR